MRGSERVLKESCRGRVNEGVVVELEAEGLRDIGGGRVVLARTGDGGGAETFACAVDVGLANVTPKAGVVVEISHNTRLASLRTLSSPTARS